ncbi:hypothetical protein D3C78_1501990 [compost metagenome]
MLGGGEPDAARRLVPVLAQPRQLALYPLIQGTQALQQPLPRLGRRDTAGGARQQAYPEPRL